MSIYSLDTITSGLGSDVAQRKQRCDTGLPRCGPCERTNQHCEYFDQAKGVNIPRHYVVHLQHKVRDLERQLEALETEDLEPDPESIVRDGAAVRIREDDESKFLGPSSGIAITRLVMHLAKRFTGSESINEIIDKNKAQEIEEVFAEEEKKPTSKVYPEISDVAAPELPPRNLTDVLVKLFNAKGRSEKMCPSRRLTVCSLSHVPFRPRTIHVARC